MNILDKLLGKKPQIRNCFHEDFAHLVEPAFVGPGVGGPQVQYYRFKGGNELDMAAGRYAKASKFLLEAQMRINSEDLDYFLSRIEDKFNGDRFTAKEAADVLKIVEVIRDRTKLLAEDKTMYQLASVVYFDDSEVLDGYDYRYNIQKIEAWRACDFINFIYTRPMSEYIPLPDTWRKDSQKLLRYLRQGNEHLSEAKNWSGK